MPAGVAAWLETADGPAQAAIFYLPGQEKGEVDTLFALDHHDPFSNANVIARGIVGDLKGAAVVASPIYKQHMLLFVPRTHCAFDTHGSRCNV